MSSVIRVGVLDEQEVIHYGLRACFSAQSDIEFTGGYYRTNSALHAVDRGTIDLLLVGHVLKIGDGLDFIRTISDKHPSLRILLFLSAPCPTTIDLLIDAGAHGVVCKCQPLEVCVEAIRLVALGQYYRCPSIVFGASPGASLDQTGAYDAETALLSYPSLTLREREVLRLCISGLTVTRIAELFSRSLKTVSTQKQAAYRKLGLKSDMDLFRRLARYGI